MHLLVVAAVLLIATGDGVLRQAGIVVAVLGGLVAVIGFIATALGLVSNA